jgi:glycosyltransferase involved in cell wall biosynthesis
VRPVKVSVVLTTYNHERFIRTAIDSIVSQIAEFSFELIISEDCSKDSTRDIIYEYKHRYPRLITLILSEANLNSNYVTRRAIEATVGEYIAFIDGDDYWTSTKKLQLQADFLDSHPDCALCFHSVDMVDEFGTFMKAWPIRPALSTLEDLIDKGNFIPGPTPMIRRSAIESLPSWFDYEAVYVDWSLYLVAASFGHIGYLPQSLSAYRRHAGGYWSSQSKAQRLASTIASLRVYESVLDHSYRDAIQRRIDQQTKQLINALQQSLAGTYKELSVIFAQQKRWDEALDAAREAIENDPEKAGLHHHLGNLFQKAGRLSDAEIAYRRAIELNPKLGATHKQLSNIFAKQERREEALEAARRAVESDPEKPGLHHHLGNLLQKWGRLSESEAADRRTIELNPKEGRP